MVPYSFTVGPFSTNCYFYMLSAQSSECCIIDPGEEGQRLINELKAAHLVPRIVLLTHGHFDHITALPFLREEYGQSLEIAIHQADATYLGPDAQSRHCAVFADLPQVSAFVAQYWKPIPPPSRILSEGDHIGSLEVLHVPGHSPGSVAFYDKEAGIVFTGDTLFKNAVGSTAFADSDARHLTTSLKRLAGLAGNPTIFPGHGHPASLTESIQYNHIV
ncbi:MAG: MBL fold metallo-hydrolase [Spirochaetaceae bacterium]|jgi:glyoxylase-like metal-dependent hydrolase (beta-lactamase superfamily II)|nr:MBL fold metallo-hydrolase [Spirochaetaceae bacterium]